MSEDAQKQPGPGARTTRFGRLSSGNLAVCEHCKNSMDFVGDRYCKPCRRMFIDDLKARRQNADALFRAETRKQLRIFGWIALFGAVIITVLSYWARTRF